MNTELWDTITKQPFGTRLIRIKVLPQETKILLLYKVVWWWLPIYWVRLIKKTIKAGVILQFQITEEEPERQATTRQQPVTLAKQDEEQVH